MLCYIGQFCDSRSSERYGPLVRRRTVSSLPGPTSSQKKVLPRDRTLHTHRSLRNPSLSDGLVRYYQARCVNEADTDRQEKYS